MSEYHKIQTLYKRDPENNHKTLLDGQFARPEFEYLSSQDWVLTEKVDGTNIRVIWDGSSVALGGKTDRAHIPVDLVNYLTETFTVERMTEVFGDSSAVLYGEGYGAKIQKGGGRYISGGVGFILFDVQIGIWLERPNVEDIAVQFGISVVPIVATCDTYEAVDIVRDGFNSRISEDKTLMAEGVVMRPAVELMDRRGHRIIAKLKNKDFTP